MNQKPRGGKPLLLGTFLTAAVIAAMSSGPTVAQPVSVEGGNAQGSALSQSNAMQGVGLALGYNSDYEKLTLSYDTPTLWTHQFQNSESHIDLDLELGLSYWNARRGSPSSMWQVSAIPIIRWWPTAGFYIEGGVGPTVLSRSQFAGEDLSTRFQFGSYLGTGLLLNKRHRVGVRYAHYSNANIKKPNPGLDLIELNYTYRF